MNPILKQKISALSVAFLGFAEGMVTVFPGVVIAQWERDKVDINLTTAQTYWFVSIAQLLAVPGSVLGGILMERVGPRRLALCVLPGSALMWILIMNTAHSPSIMIACRAVHGLFNTTVCVIMCFFPVELADVQRRGFFGSIVNAFCAIGYLTMYALSGSIPWQYIGYVVIAISIVPSFIGVYFAPESPLWLARHKQFEKAKTEMARIRNSSDNIVKELLNEREKFEHMSEHNIMESIKLLAKLHYFLPVSAAVLLLFLKEITGQLAVTLFVFQIFQSIGVKISSYWCSIGIGITRILSSSLSSVLLSRVRRRLLLKMSALISSSCLGVLGFYFYLDSWNTQFDLRFLPLILLMVSVVAYGLGIGPGCWLVAAEIQPSAVRNIGGGLAQAGYNIGQWLVAGTFVVIKESIGVHWCFWIYAVGCLVFFIFISLLPETKGKSFTENENYWIDLKKGLTKGTNELGNDVKCKFSPVSDVEINLVSPS